MPLGLDRGAEGISRWEICCGGSEMVVEGERAGERWTLKHVECAKED